jgi:hypothetical protein
MQSRYTRALTTFAVAGALAIPAVAQARGGSDDPPNHEQRTHQVRHHVRHHRADNLRPERRDDRGDRDRRGSDDGPNHR